MGAIVGDDSSGEGLPWEDAKSVVTPPLRRRQKRWFRRQRFHGIIDHRAAMGQMPGDLDAYGKFRRQAGCGRWCIDGRAGMELRATNTDDGPNVYPAGVQSCGSVWLCPVCSAKIRARRSMEVQLAAITHTAAAGTLVMLTLTARHNRHHGLGQLLDGVQDAWRSLQQSERWRSTVRAELVGMIVATEVTIGPNGWHPHLHILLCLPAGAEGLADELQAWLPEAWRSRVGNRLGVSPTLAHGVHVLELGANSAAYVAKIGDETTRADLKSDATNPFSLLDAGIDDTRATGQWIEYAETMKGRRALVWSRGLKAELLPKVEELTDDELAAVIVQGQFLQHLTGAEWARLCKGQIGGVVQAVAYLEAWERRLSSEKVPIP